jgi:hypothetical protein
MSQIQLGLVSQPSASTAIFSWSYPKMLDRQGPVIAQTLQIKNAGTPWTKVFVNRQIRPGTKRLQIGNIPTGRNLQARLIIQTIYTVPSRLISNIVSFSTIVAPSQPSNVRAVRNSLGGIIVSWNSLSDGGSPPLRFYVDYSINGGSTWYSEVVTASQTTPVGPQAPNTPITYSKQFNFSAENRNNTFIFRVTALNSAGMTSIPSAITNPIYLEPISGSSVLFDKTSWEIIPSPWRERLIFAAEEWEKFVKINPAYLDIISRQIQFRGIRISQITFIEEPLSNLIASCGIDNYILINPNTTTQNKFVPFDIRLTINSSKDMSNDQWNQFLVHELGHGLGIGLAWQPNILAEIGKSTDLAPLGAPFYAIPTRRNKTSQPAGTINYPNMERAYDGLRNTQNTRFIPLMWQPEEDEFQRFAHFSYEINPHNHTTRSWGTVPEDIMSYGFRIGVAQRITSLSIGALLDFGYVLANTVIEANQNVVLSYDPITGYTYANSIPITYGGRNVPYQNWGANSPAQFPVWTVVAADIVGGVNKLVQKHESGLLFTWNMTSNWEYESYEQNAQAQPLYVGLNTPEYFAKEITFQTDFNKNGIVGQ